MAVVQYDGNLLRVDRLSKAFTIRRGLASIRFVAVNQASFSLRCAVPEILTLAGESGSGKTTLARHDPGHGRADRRAHRVPGPGRQPHQPVR